MAIATPCSWDKPFVRSCQAAVPIDQVIILFYISLFPSLTKFIFMMINEIQILVVVVWESLLRHTPHVAEQQAYTNTSIFILQCKDINIIRHFPLRWSLAAGRFAFATSVHLESGQNNLRWRWRSSASRLWLNSRYYHNLYPPPVTQIVNNPSSNPPAGGNRREKSARLSCCDPVIVLFVFNIYTYIFFL